MEWGFSTQAMCRRPSLISGSLSIVLLRVLPLPPGLKVGDETPASSQGNGAALEAA